MSSAPRAAQRGDARDNRERLLEAAGELIAERGLDVPLYLVARRAGVGNGTLHRHFPDREALLAGLTLRASIMFAVVVEAALDIDDPWDSLVAYLDGVIALTLLHSWTDTVIAHARQHPPAGWVPGRWIQETVDLVERAKADGALRADVLATDLAFFAPVLRSLATLPEPSRSTVIARHRSLLLDALRPVGAERPPLGAEPLGLEAFRELIRIRTRE